MIRKIEISFTEDADYEEILKIIKPYSKGARIHTKNIPNPYKKVSVKMKNTPINGNKANDDSKCP